MLLNPTINNKITCINKIKFRPIFIEFSDIYPEAWAEITINGTTYHIPKSGTTIIFDPPIYSYHFESAYIKLYAYNRKPFLSHYTNTELSIESMQDINLTNIIPTSATKTLTESCFIHCEPRADDYDKIDEDDTYKPKKIIDIISDQNNILIDGHYWIPIPKKYIIAGNMIDLIFIQTYPAIVFTLADAIKFYDFLLEEHLNAPSHWHYLLKYRDILLIDAARSEFENEDLTNQYDYM
jgi:hypothetical protein